MRTQAAVCAHPPCNRKTLAPTGLCHLHESTPTSVAFTPTLPAPAYPRRDFEPEPRVTDDGYGGTETLYGKPSAPHRLMGPAIVTTLSDGSVKEEWYSYGERHRIGGPAEIERDPSGGIEYETYYREGKKHRIDGPAHAEYGPDGKATREKFYVFGEEAPNGIGKALEGYSPESMLLAIEESPFAVLMEEDDLDPYEIVELLGSGVRTPEGAREVLSGSPPEWVRAYEEGKR